MIRISRTVGYIEGNGSQFAFLNEGCPWCVVLDLDYVREVKTKEEALALLFPRKELKKPIQLKLF